MVTVNAIRDLGPVEVGETNARYFLCDDGNDYVVKFTNQQEGKRAINEIVGGTIACQINLPAPETVLVNISDELALLYNNPELVTAGIHTGSRRIINSWNLNHFTDYALAQMRLINNNDVYGLVSFDNWTINTDRFNLGNILIQKKGPDLRFWVIDFGWCFADPEWDSRILQNSINRTTPVRQLPFVVSRIRNVSNFNPWLTRIEGFLDQNIINIISDVPPSWNFDANEAQSLSVFITNRKHLVRTIVNDNYQ